MNNTKRKESQETYGVWTILVSKEDGTEEKKTIDPSNQKDRFSQFIVSSINKTRSQLEDLKRPPSRYNSRGKKISQGEIDARSKFNQERIPFQEHALKVLEGRIIEPIKVFYATDGTFVGLHIQGPRPKD